MANNYQLNATLSFTADTAKAKAELQSLQQTLNNLTLGKIGVDRHSPLTKDILDAQQAAGQLSISLKNATNVDTGKLNLTKFSTELQKSGMDLNKYRLALSKLGPEGEKAFLGMAQQVMQADVTLKTSNKLVNDLWISLKNVAKWQISGSVVRGLVGGIQSAFGYAKDLNESLNNIQIVTQKSSQEMAQFAIHANKAAKELGTTTTAYSDAALIYYQQGLDGEAVEKRTDITIKAANAAGASAEEMSSYLTAVWNSYKVGEEELEKYVDIMAALGAGTATSLEEISTAMEKVASVGEATGVSFEQLSSIIATVSSVTRTSAESVGTAYKTIFSRMADLKLEGSIDEDGVTTTLGTVSSQLEQVGVHILDDKGELRDMGKVIEELMDKWGGMNEATRQAVAIAVAGKRQYTQLLALMNNQDMYKDAMGLATGAEGTLEKQNEVYAQSWEAASKRVKAAAEGIYDSLINDKFFIDFNNKIADALGLIEKLIDSLGGMPGVLGLIGTLMTKVFNEQMSQSIANMAQSMFSMSVAGQSQADKMRAEAVKQSQFILSNPSNRENNMENEITNKVMTSRLELQNKFISKVKEMSEEEKMVNQILMDRNKEDGERLILLAKEYDQIKKNVEEQSQNYLRQAGMYGNREQAAEALNNLKNNIGLNQLLDINLESAESIQQLIQSLKELDQETPEVEQRIQSLIDKIEQPIDVANFDSIYNRLEQLEQVSHTFDDIGFSRGYVAESVQEEAVALEQVIQAYEKDIAEKKQAGQATEQLEFQVKALRKEFESIKVNPALQRAKQIISESAITYTEFVQRVHDIGRASGMSNQEIQNLIHSLAQEHPVLKRVQEGVERYNEAIENTTLYNQQAQDSFSQIGTNAVKAIQSISQLTMGFMSLKGIVNTLKNEDLSFFDKVLQVTMSLSMAIPSLAMGFSNFASSFSQIGASVTSGLTQMIAATYEAAAAKGVETGVTELSADAQAEENAQDAQSIALKNAQKVLDGLSAKEKFALIAAKVFGLTITKLENKEGEKQITLEAKNALGKAVLALATKLKAKASGENTAAMGAETTATVGLDIATKSLLLTFAAIVVAIGLVIAVAAGLVMLFQDIACSSVDQKLKDIDSAIEDLSSSLEEAKTEAEELTKAIQDIQSGYNAISKMTQGTEEFSEAVAKTNEQVLELLEKYPELYNYLSRDPNTNLLKIDQKGFDALLTSQQAEIGAKQMALVAAQTRKAELTIEQYNEDWKDSSMGSSKSGGNYANKLKQLGGANDYSKIAAMTDRGLEEAIKKDNSALIKELQHRDSKNTIAFVGDELPEDWKEQVRGDAKTLANAEAIRDRQNALNIAIAQEAVYKGSGGSLRVKDAAQKDDFNDRIEKITSEAKKKAESFDKDQGWNKHQNYSEDNQEWKDIKKVVASLGPDASYVAQRQGEMVISVGGEEKKYTEEQFKTMLQEVYFQEALENLINTKQMTVSDSLKGAGIDQKIINHLSTEDQAALDNIQYSLQKTINDNESYDKGKYLFEGLTNDVENMSGDKAAAVLKNMTEAFNSTDWSEGSEAAEVFTDKLDQLGIKINKQNKETLIEYANKFKMVAKWQEGAAAYTEKLTKTLEQQAEEVGLSEIAMENYVEQLKENAEYSKLNNKQLKEAAINQKKSRNALDELAKSWESVTKAVKENDIMSEDYEKGITALSKAYKELFGLDVSNEFLTDAKNLELMEKALMGDQEAFDELSKSVAQNWRENLDFSGMAEKGFSSAADRINNAFDKVNNLIDNADFSTELNINAGDAINTLNELIRQGKVTVDELNGYFGSVKGVEFETDVEYMNPGDAVAATTASSNTTTTINTITPIDEDGNPTDEPRREQIVSQVSSFGNADVNESGQIAVPILKTKGSNENGKGNIHKVPGIDVTAGSNARSQVMGNKNGGKSGGGGSSKGSSGKSKSPQKTKKQTTDPVRKEDEIERYKNINNNIESYTRNLERVQKTREHSFGGSYLANLDKENALLLQGNKLLDDKIKEAQKYKNVDLEFLTGNKDIPKSAEYLEVFGDKEKYNLGIDVQFDENGVITNVEEIQEQVRQRKNADIKWYDDEMNALNAWWDNVNNAAGEEGVSDADKEHYEEEKERIEKEKELRDQANEDALKAIDNLEEANQIMYEAEMERQENLYKIRSNNLDKINYKLERQLQLIENENKLLELQKRILMQNSKYWASPEIFSQVLQKSIEQSEEIMANGSAYTEKFQQLMTADLNDKERAEALNDTFQGLTEAIGSALDQIEEMKEAIPNLINTITEELDKLYSRFDNITSVLDSYKSLSELLVWKDDKDYYRYMKRLLDTTETVTKNQFKASQDSFDHWKNEYEKYNNQLRSITDKNSTEYEIALKASEAAYEQMAESQQSMLDNAQKWVETLAEIRDLDLEDTFRRLENRLTNDEGFDKLKSKIDLLKSQDEYYLTATNQQYETQKLIRKAQQDLDKASNTMAKNRLQLYINQTTEMQKQSKLSKLELQVQQERYNLTLAEIALEEAQNNKSQVTLQRDTEGNFNYVYTADEDKIAEAQQKVEDSQNTIYNLLRDGVNNFAQAMLELDEEFRNELQDIDMNTLEGQRKAQELRKIYLEKRNMIEEQYNYAAEEIGDKLVEAYGDDIRENILSTEDFGRATKTCVDDMRGIWDSFRTKTDEVKELVNTDLTSMKTESNELKNAIIKLDEDGEKALSDMDAAMEDWTQNSLARLNEQIKEWSVLLQKIKEVLQLQSGFSSSTNYMAVYERSSTIAGAKTALQNRDMKVQRDELNRWEDNTTELMKEFRDQSAQIMNSETAAAALDAAARREAKIQWIDENTDIHLRDQVENTVDWLLKYFNSNSKLEDEKKSKVINQLEKYKESGIELTDDELDLLRYLSGYNTTYAEKWRKMGYATGGYTGDFADSTQGKLAILHEKELVLNKDDTKNFLKAINLTDAIMENLKMARLQYSNILQTNLLDNNIGKYKEQIEQQVHIEAEFPNVTDHNEIEIAIENLINTSAQYAAR